MQKSFIRLRDDVIRNLARSNNFEIQKLLQTMREHVIMGDNDAIISDQYVRLGCLPLAYYLKDRDLLFPDSLWLFPTNKGSFYGYSKYKQNQIRSQLGSDLPRAYIHPKELSESQELALRQTSFSYYRYSLQVRLVVKLCARLGLRASEPTMLERQHLDFGNRKIYLTVTNSQKPQELPLLSDLVEPLRLFSRLLPKHDDRLFVKCGGEPWKRIQVLRAVAWWGEIQGVERRVIPRVLRATVGARLAKQGFPIKFIAMLLRHEDEATALRHYTVQEFEEFRKALEDISDPYTLIN
jgi:site-specific recombinase XerC